MTQRGETAPAGLKRSRWTRFKARLAARLDHLWKPQLYACLLLGFLLGRALPGSQVAPFGIAFYAALRGAGFSAVAGLPAALAVIAGAWGALPLGPAVWVALAVLMTHLACSILHIGEKGATPLGAALVASAAAAIPVAMLVGRPSVLQLALWAGVTGVLALIFTLAIADITSGRAFQVGATDSPVPAITILAAALCGLDGLHITTLISLREVAAALVVMACAYAGGPPLGAAAGAVLGVSFLFASAGPQAGLVGDLAALAGSMPQAQAMAYVVAGTLAGTFRELHKGGVAVAFALGLVTYAMVMIPDAGQLLVLSYSVSLAVLLFWLAPRGWLGRIPASLVTTSEPPHEGPRRHEGEPPVVIDRIRGMSRVLREVSRTFEQVASVDLQADQSTGRLFDQVVDRVCHSCSLYRQCWETDFHKTYQHFTDLWDQLDEEGPLTPDQLGQFCIKPDRVSAALNHLYDLARSQQNWERRLDEGRSVVGEYLKNMTQLLDRFVEEVGSGGLSRWPDRQPAMRVQSGIARLPRRGSLISGDSFVGSSLGTDRYLLALSDGMGVGRGAALESKQCVKLLHEMIDAGFSTEAAVHTVNSVLLLRSPDESFATVDLALLDLATGRAEFVKVGAAPSFIKRGDQVMVVKMANVPIGIINRVQVEPEFRLLRPGDILVMITDGVWDLSKDDVDKERWLIEHLGREVATDPEEIAESLLARARELLCDMGDDMTVLVARVDRLGGGQLQAVDPKPGGESVWAPVRRAPRLGRSGLRRASKR